MENILSKAEVMGNLPRSGYKKTELGRIPEDWEIKNVDQIAKVIMGQSPNGNTYNNLGIGKPLINGPTEFTDKYPIRKQWTSSPTKMCKEKDILLCVRGSSTGRINIADDSYCIGRGVAAIRANTNLHQKFVEIQLMNGIQKILNLTSGSTFPNIDSKSLRSIKFIVPSYWEQTGISECITQWENSIDLTSKLINRKEHLKKGLMQQLLTGQKRLPGFSGEWKDYTYKVILKEVKRDFEWDDNAKYDLISVRRRSGGLFYRESLFGHQIKTKNLREAKAGDFLISKMQILHGASGLTTMDFDEMKISGSYIAVVSRDENVLDINFLNWYSKLRKFYHQCYISSYGVHMEKMTFDFNTFLKEKIRIPEVKEQKAITKFFETSQLEIELLKKKKELIENQKKGLMQQLLTGKKRIKK